MKMKAISIRQPWAWLITDFKGAGAIPPKRLENRRTLKNIRGRHLIHAGQKYDWDGYKFLWRHWGSTTRLENGLIESKAAQRGGIVGVCDIVGVVCYGAELPVELHGQEFWRAVNQNSLILRNVSPVKFFPCPGKLSVFEVDYPYAI